MAMNGSCLADYRCERLGSDFSYLFRYQFVISKEADRQYPGWSRQTLQGWTLHHGPELLAASIRDSAGRLVGFVLGRALTDDSKPVRGTFQLGLPVESPKFLAHAEQTFTFLSGRYLVILLTPTAQRIYGDPTCELTAVFDEKNRKVGSSLGVLLDRDIHLNPDYAIKDVLSGKVVPGFGYTIDSDVMRLMPNFYLDLETFSRHRFWPKRNAKFKGEKKVTNSELVQLIMDRLSRHMRAYAENYDCIFPLTSGRDSRILLAASKGFTDQFREISGFRFHNQSRIDVLAASRMADAIGLPYRQKFFERKNHKLMREMRLKTGWSTFRGEFKALPIMDTYSPDHLLLRGGVVELTRGQHWQRASEGKLMRHMLRRLKPAKGLGTSKVDNFWAARAWEWWLSLPKGAREKTYDFMHVELWLPSTLGPYYAGFHKTFPMSPFNDRRLIRMTICLPVQQRVKGEFVRKLIADRHPELLDFGFQ